MSDVKRLARWTGWCDPCETERPLVLTETGERGIRAWLRGIGAEDRALTLTCGVCGEWQDVPHDEDDIVEAQPSTPLVALLPVGAHQVVVRSTPVRLRAVDPIPAPRPVTDSDNALELVAEGLDLIAMAG